MQLLGSTSRVHWEVNPQRDWPACPDDGPVDPSPPNISVVVGERDSDLLIAGQSQSRSRPAVGLPPGLSLPAIFASVAGRVLGT